MSRNPPIAAIVAGMMVAALLLAGAAFWLGGGSGDALVSFRDRGELAAYLDSRGSFSTVPGGAIASFDTARGPLLETAAGGDHSRTNVQVEGIDEMDIVKTDGSHLYVASGGTVYVVDAVPADRMSVVATIDAREALGDPDAYDHAWVSGLFLDGRRLVVIASGYERSDDGAWPQMSDRGLWFSGLPRTGVAAYDVSTVGDPVVEHARARSGTPVAARLADGHAYVIVQDWIRKVDGEYALPLRCDGARCAPVDVATIVHDPQAKEVGAFTTVLAVRLDDGAENAVTAVTGFTSAVYMSHGAIYLTYLKWEGSDPVLPERSDPSYTTTIHKVRVEGLTLLPSARGDVPGVLLNQFSLDEHEGRLRVATTTGWQDPSSGVYVLSADLRPLGALEGIAPSERIFAARFVGETLYLVTFRLIDPLFVIDLSDTSPRILGELEVPGFSSYLHTWGEGRVVGVGQEDWGVKVTLFDVADPARPSEVATVRVPDSWSEALGDHKAVLADPGRDLLVLPIAAWTTQGDSASGAHVFEVTPGGVTLRGVVRAEDAWGWGSGRALYIGDVLYLVTSSSVTAAALGDLAVVGSLGFVSPGR